VIPVVFLVSGVVLFISNKSLWGVVLGMPMIIIGGVMVIYTYDEVITKKTQPLSEELARCGLCNKLTPRPPGINPEDVICSRCKKEVLEGIEKSREN
jgi:hypothetical protein